MRQHPILLFPLLAAPLAADGGDGEHYFREPEVVESFGDPVTQLALESDEELSVALFKVEGASDSIAAVTSDGRAIEWSVPTTLSTSALLKDVQRDSIQVVGEQAAAFWLERDAAGPGLDRVVVETYGAGAWDPGADGPLTIELGYPAGATVDSWAALLKPGINGNLYAYVLAGLSVGGGPSRPFLSVSSINGAFFSAAVPVATGGAAASVEGLALDSQQAEVHVSWTEDRAAAGTDEVFYRGGLADFVGNLIWFEDERVISAGAGDVQGTPIVTVNGQKVGVGYIQVDGGASPQAEVVASANSGFNFGAPENVSGGVLDVFAIDLELSGETFIVAWEQEKVNGKHEIRRGESKTGTGFTNSQVSGEGGAEDHDASSPQISRSVGLPAGSVMLWTEIDEDGGTEVITAFGDQDAGGEWHDEFPFVSEAEEAGALVVFEPRIAYNDRYYNFPMAWLQDTPGAPGVPSVHIGGYRPHDVDVDGWVAGVSTSISFDIGHLPFEDVFAFVLLGAGYAGGPGLPLMDGRNTGLLFDPFLTNFSISNFALFTAINDPAARGASTEPFGPVLLPAGLPLSMVAVSWGPYGELHHITDVITAVSEVPAP
ncbi:MAG: hypothetical protein AAF682_13510 [Planctomycetota bacterium]